MSDARRKLRLSIVSPCFNEAEVVRAFYEALRGLVETLGDVECEIILVDDGSTDATLDRLNEIAREDSRVVAISLSRNFGHQTALTAGIDAARGEALVMMDSDLQHPPALIPEMVRRWREEKFDVVSAVRRKTPGAGIIKNATSRGFYHVINLLSDTRIEPGAADFCLLSRRAYRSLARMPERHRFLRGLVAWMGFRRSFLEYDAAPRAAGTSKYSFAKMLRLALDATFSFSAAPIAIAVRGGLLLIALGLIYLVYVIVRVIFRGTGVVSGWGSLMSVILIFFGMQFVLIGMIGSYLGRVYEQVKQRPIYLLKQRRQRTGNGLRPRRKRRRADRSRIDV